MKIKKGTKSICISFGAFGGDIVDFTRIDGVTAQSFENVIRAIYEKCTDDEKQEIYCGHFALTFDFKIEK